jgi:hypothetical protein
MKYKAGIPAMLVSLSLLSVAVAIAAPQDESGNSKNGDAAKTDDKRTKKPVSDATITLHIKVSLEGKSALPSQSKIELSSDDETCVRGVQTASIKPDSGEASFEGLRTCRQIY